MGNFNAKFITTLSTFRVFPARLLIVGRSRNVLQRPELGYRPTKWPQHQNLLEDSGLQEEVQIWTSSRWWGSSRQRSQPGTGSWEPLLTDMSVVKSVSRWKGLSHQAYTGWDRTPVLGEDQGYCAGYQNKTLEGRRQPSKTLGYGLKSQGGEGLRKLKVARLSALKSWPSGSVDISMAIETVRPGIN